MPNLGDIVAAYGEFYRVFCDGIGHPWLHFPPLTPLWFWELEL